MIDINQEIRVINRGKVAYLHVNNIFEDRIEKVTIDGREQYCWVYKRSDEVFKLIEQFNQDKFLKRYNSAFKNLAYDLAKFKSREF